MPIMEINIIRNYSGIHHLQGDELKENGKTH